MERVGKKLPEWNRFIIGESDVFELLCNRKNTFSFETGTVYAKKLLLFLSLLYQLPKRLWYFCAEITFYLK